MGWDEIWYWVWDMELEIFTHFVVFEGTTAVSSVAMMVREIMDIWQIWIARSRGEPWVGRKAMMVEKEEITKSSSEWNGSIDA